MAAVLHYISSSAIAKCLIAAPILYILQTIIYAFFFSPVRDVPGPWWARVSELPLKYHILKSRRSTYATALLERYGPVVVIAPNQVHTNDPEAIKTIYNKNSRKTDFYANQGTWKGVTNTLGHRRYADAAPMRRRLLSFFSNQNLVKLVEDLSSHVDDLIAVISKHIGEDLNILVPMRLLALDVIADVLWGEQKRLMHSYEDGSVPPFLRRFNAFSTYSPMKSFLPGFDTYVSYFGSSRWRELRKEAMDVDLNVRQALSSWEGGHEERDKDVLSMLKSMDSEDRMPDNYIPAHMVEMLGAGSVTTALTASHICWQLAHNQEAQAQLHGELVSAFPEISRMDPSKSVALPFLDAVIRETMRLRPIIPGPQQRVLGDELFVRGFKLPAGVIASCAAWDQHRVSSIYPDADTWIPSRWLDGKATEAMHQNWMVFGVGARQCPGLNLGLTELKYIISMVFRRFHAMPPAKAELDGNETQDTFLAIFKKGGLWLRFREMC